MNIKEKKLRKYSKIIYIIIILLLILCLILINIKNISSQDEILFLKFLKIGKNQDENSIESQKNIQTTKGKEQIAKYEFKITYKNVDFKNVNLADTINQETLIYEKIAPGVKGEFEIIIDSNKTMNYKINFNSINEKPQNL